MPYNHLVKKLVRQSFENVNNHNYDDLLKAVAPNVHHRFAGAHSIGGERHDKEAMRHWLGRVGRVLPNLGRFHPDARQLDQLLPFIVVISRSANRRHSRA